MIWVMVGFGDPTPGAPVVEMDQRAAWDLRERINLNTGYEVFVVENPAQQEIITQMIARNIAAQFIDIAAIVRKVGS